MERSPLFFSASVLALQKIAQSLPMAHTDFLLSIFPIDKHMSMRLMYLMMHVYLSNKFLSWKPSKAGETSLSSHNWHSMKYL